MTTVYVSQQQYHLVGNKSQLNKHINCNRFIKHLSPVVSKSNPTKQ